MSAWLHELNRDAVLQAVARNVVRPVMPKLPRYLDRQRRSITVQKTEREGVAEGFERLPADHPARTHETWIPSRETGSKR